MEESKPHDGVVPNEELDRYSPPSTTNPWKGVATNIMIGASGGAIGGAMLATYRGHSVPFYTASMGMNYAIASSVFFGTEMLIRNARGGERDALGYAGAGLTMGLAMTWPIGGRYRAAVAGIAMAAVGYGGFYAHRRARAYVDRLGQQELRRRELERRQINEAQQMDASNPQPQAQWRRHR